MKASITIPESKLYYKFFQLLLIVQTAATAWKIITYGSSINSFLFMRGVSETSLESIDLIMGWGLIVLALPLAPKHYRWALWPLGSVFLALSCFRVLNDGDRFAGLSPLAEAIRIVLPIAYFFFIAGNKNMAQWLLRVATAITFVVHGYECLAANDVFIDYLIGTAKVHLALELTESHAVNALFVIGAVDIVVAILLVVKRWRAVALYMALWGGIAAFSRVTHSGWAAGWYEALARVANGGGPLLLFCFWKKSNK